MQIEHLREFIELGRCLNFSQAARRLHLAQSTLTRHIARLEREAGVPLLTRTTRMVELTDAGRVLLERIEPVVDAYNEALEQARAAFGTGMELRIAFPYYFAERYLQPALDAFAQRFPQATPALIPIQPQEALELLQQGACDISFEIVYPYAIPDTRLRGCAVGREGFCIALPATHPLASKDALAPQDLDGQCFVNPSSYPAFSRFVAIYCEKHGIAPGRTVEVGSVELIYPAIMRNDALAFCIAESGVQERDGIAYIPFAECPQATIRIATWEEGASPQAQAFLGAVEAGL